MQPLMEPKRSLPAKLQNQTALPASFTGLDAESLALFWLLIESENHNSKLPVHPLWRTEQKVSGYYSVFTFL